LPPWANDSPRCSSSSPPLCNGPPLTKPAPADVNTQVEQLIERYQSKNMPQLPAQPYSPERVEAYLLLVKKLRDQELPRDLAIAEQATQNTAANAQRSGTLLHALRGEWPRRLGEGDVQLAGQVAFGARNGTEYAEWVTGH
jgi:hypothetical protein